MQPSWVNMAGFYAYIAVFVVLTVRGVFWFWKHQIRNYDLKLSDASDMKLTQWALHFCLQIAILFLVLGLVFVPMAQEPETLLMLGIGVFGVIGLGWCKDMLERTYGAWEYIYGD